MARKDYIIANANKWQLARKSDDSFLVSQLCVSSLCAALRAPLPRSRYRATWPSKNPKAYNGHQTQRRLKQRGEPIPVSVAPGTVLEHRRRTQWRATEALSSHLTDVDEPCVVLEPHLLKRDSDLLAVRRSNRVQLHGVPPYGQLLLEPCPCRGPINLSPRE